MVVLEVEDVAQVRAAPGVDRLVGVADHAEVAVLPGELAHQLVLHAVRVLVLVDEHVLEAAAGSGAAPPESRANRSQRAQQQVAEVERVRVREQALVGGVDVGGAPLLEIERGLGGGGRQPALVLPLVDAPEHAARLGDLGIEPVALLRLLHDAERVRFVVDREAAREAEVGDLAAQDAHADGMEGREPDRGGLAADQLLRPARASRRRPCW